MASTPAVPARVPAGVYWALVVLLTAFGMLAIFSIGFPFFVLGVTLAVLWPLRERPALFWTVIAAEVGFFVGYVLVAPLACTATATSTGTGGSVDCTNVLGIDHSGTVPYNPPLWPAILAGAGSAAIVGSAAWLALRGGVRSLASSR